MKRIKNSLGACWSVSSGDPSLLRAPQTSQPPTTAALRDAYRRIQALSLKGGDGLTRSAIREALALPDSTVRRWLGELVELEYLEADAGKQGKVARYALTGRAPKDDLVLGLLSPEDLRARL